MLTSVGCSAPLRKNMFFLLSVLFLSFRGNRDIKARVMCLFILLAIGSGEMGEYY